MKLNNHGWGLGQMFIGMGILCVALLYVFFNAYKISNIFIDLNNTEKTTNVGTSEDNNVNIPITYYKSLEAQIKNATQNYIESYYSGEPFTSKTIDYLTLLNAGVISELKDGVDNTECDGYATINNNIINGYVKCSNYQTEGY